MTDSYQQNQKLGDAQEDRLYVQMQKEMILQKLKEARLRVTKQRIAVIDIILENDCSSCKEIYYKTAKINRKIGAATVYRTINMLEQIGAIDRKNMYRFQPFAQTMPQEGIVITLEDGTEQTLSPQEWNEALQKGLEVCGYLKKGESISAVSHPAKKKAESE